MVLLRTPPPDGRRYDELLRAGLLSPDGPAWWLPAMVHLALADPELTTRARSVLQGWQHRRHECVYAVVQEETDDHLSLTGSPWPLVDDRGRLRFRVTDDPIECHAERSELQAFVDWHRAQWHGLGLVGIEQSRRPIRLGDVFAVPLVRANGAVVQLVDRPLRRSSVPADLFLVPSRSSTPDLAVMDVVEHTETDRVRRRKIASTGAPVVDITWDARQAGKVAQLAAFAGVLTATSDTAQPSGDAPQPGGEHGRTLDDSSDGATGGSAPPGADDELIAEGRDRQLRAYLEGLDPDAARDLPTGRETQRS